MYQSKIYVAANERAKLLAEMLRDGLREYRECWADVWQDVDKLGLSKIDTLEHLVNNYEFAVIILARDDLVDAKGSEDTLKTRGDCILEAGFFMASLGKARCFLVSSVEKNLLPSDLEGIISITFKDPADLNSQADCKRQMEPASTRIKNRVDEIRKDALHTRIAATRPLSRQALLDREQLEPKGQLNEDQVVVASGRPRELAYPTAARIRENIDANVSYVYFCEGNRTAASKIPHMLQLVLLVPFLKSSPEDAGSFQKRLQLVKDHKTDILEDLIEIRSLNKLNIYFLSEPLEVQFWIHNATNQYGTARMYMERSEEYIEWGSGEEAQRFWNRLQDRKCAQDPLNRQVVFHGGPNFDLKNEPFYGTLRQNMLSYFPEIGDEALQLCLEEFQGAAAKSVLPATRKPRGSIARKRLATLTSSWLHVSDFHFKGGDPYDRNVVLNALVNSVRWFREERGRRPDLIFAAGDIANSGQASEYEPASAFFDALCAAAGVDKRRLFVVPGNHDANRMLGIGLARTLGSPEDADAYFNPATPKPHISQKQRAFINWHNEYFAGIRKFPEHSTCGAFEIVDVGGCKIGVLPLNSALFCQDDHDHGQLWVGRRCIDAVTKEIAGVAADLKIALIHHPLEWLHEAERTNVKDSLQSLVDLILRGHLHETDIESVVGVAGTALHLAAGASYQTRKWPNRALYCTFRDNETDVFPIRFEDKPRPQWVVDPSIFPQDNDYIRSFPIPRLTKV